MRLFTESKFDVLALLFRLYQPIEGGLKPVSDKFKLHMIEVGRGLVSQCET